MSCVRHTTPASLPTFILRATVFASLALAAACDGCVDEPALSRTIEFCLQPAEIDFGQQLLRTAETRSLSVTNCGNVPIDEVTVTLTPVDESGAALPEGTESPFVVTEAKVPNPLPVGERFFIPIRFRPTEVGVFHGKLELSLVGGMNGEARVSLRGEGAEAPECAVSVEPTSVDFGTVLAGQSESASVTFSNTGTGACNLGGARVRDGSETFAVTAGPDAVVEAGASTTVTVSFTPDGAESYAAALAVVVDSATEIEVPLSGSGRVEERCVLSATPESVVFPRATVGFLDTSGSTTLESVGDIPCTLSSIEITEGAADFSVVSAPAAGTALAVNETASLELAFHPTSPGVRSGMARVVTDEGIIVELELQGLADPAPSCAVSFDPAPLFFDSLGVGLTATRTITATNISIVECPIEDVRVAGTVGDFVLVTPPPTTGLMPGESLTFEVSFTPLLNAPSLDELIVDHGGGETSSAELIGFGSYADFRLTPRNEHFGIITDGCVSETYDFELTNVGPVAGRVDEIRFTALSDPNFELLQTVPPGTMLAPGASRTIQARMRSAPIVAAQAAQLEVVSTGTI